MGDTIMEEILNVYCDESCHLENDIAEIMVVGAIYCYSVDTKKIYNDIKKIKVAHGFATSYEAKWTRITEGNLQLMKSLVDYFFLNESLRFRCYVIDKSGLNHQNYKQDHDMFYYKMLYRNLEFILKKSKELNIYLDIKDTKSSKKIKKLKEFLNNFSRNKNYGTVTNIQAIHSHESQLIQLADLFIGASRYKNENLNTNRTKIEFIDYLESKYQISLLLNSTLSCDKFNIFHWDRNSIREVQ
jgi:hypothetical protein